MRPLASLVPAALLIAAATPSYAQIRLVPLDIQVPVPPTPFKGGGKTHLVYELRVSNAGSGQTTIDGIDVFGDQAGQPIASRTGAELEADARIVGPPIPNENSRTLPAGRQALVYLWVTLPDGGRTPARLRHRITATMRDSVGTTRSDTVGGFYVAVRAVEPPVLGSPLSDGPWVAFNGPSNTSGHRRTAIPLYGRAQIGQRFATDWIKLGSDGRAWKGDSTVNANWVGYGVPLLAVADGIVVSTKDSIIENVPFSPKMAVPITLETVGGNLVILDIGGGHFAFYAHLQPGSLKVKLGDRVRRGQVLGLLGNSGNSTAPHLHFHLTDGNSPLGSEGLPFLFDRFELLDWPKEGMTAVMNGWRAPGPAATKAREATLENMVVRY